MRLRLQGGGRCKEEEVRHAELRSRIASATEVGLRLDAVPGATEKAYAVVSVFLSASFVSSTAVPDFFVIIGGGLLGLL